jgi:hypothetical protein
MANEENALARRFKSALAYALENLSPEQPTYADLKQTIGNTTDRIQMSNSALPGPRLPESTPAEGRYFSGLSTGLGDTVGSVGKKAAGKAASAMERKLEMTEAARMQRAQEMGFDTNKTYFHGTKQPFEGHGFDPEKIKQGRAIFVTEDPKFANKFSGGTWNERLADYDDAGANILPLLVNPKKAFDPDNIKHMAALKEAVLPRFEKRWAEVYPNDTKKQAEMVQVSLDAIDGSYPSLEKDYVLDAIQKAGFDSYHVYESGRKNLAIFDPAQVRSKFAAFDPKQAKSGNLSAGIAGATGAGALLLNEKNKEGRK